MAISAILSAKLKLLITKCKRSTRLRHEILFGHLFLNMRCNAISLSSPCEYLLK